MEIKKQMFFRFLAPFLLLKNPFYFDVGLEITSTQGHIIKGSLRIRVENKEVEEECDELVLARYLGHMCLPGI